MTPHGILHRTPWTPELGGVSYVHSLFMETAGMMARRFESGFYLIERCRRELPALAAYFSGDSAMRAALGEVVEAAAKVDSLLHAANAPHEDAGVRPDAP